MQLRIFGEAFARQIAARSNVHADERENQIERLRRLRDLGLIDHQQAELLHTLRRRGNEAAHNDPVTRSTALHALRDFEAPFWDTDYLFFPELDGQPRSDHEFEVSINAFCATAEMGAPADVIALLGRYRIDVTAGTALKIE